MASSTSAGGGGLLKSDRRDVRKELEDAPVGVAPSRVGRVVNLSCISTAAAAAVQRRLNWARTAVRTLMAPTGSADRFGHRGELQRCHSHAGAKRVDGRGYRHRNQREPARHYGPTGPYCTWSMNELESPASAVGRKPMFQIRRTSTGSLAMVRPRRQSGRRAAAGSLFRSAMRSRHRPERPSSVRRTRQFGSDF